MADIPNPYGNIGTLPPEVYQQQQELNRRQQLAQALMQNNQQPQGQMISGRYVAPSFFQNLQPVVNALTGAYLAKKGDEQALELSKALKNTYSDELNQFNQLLAKNPMEAYSFAAQAYNPKLQEVGMKKMLPEEITLSEGQKRFVTLPDGSVKEVASGGEKLHAVGKNLVTSTGKVVYSAPLTGEEKANPQEAGLRSSFFNQAQPHIQISQAYRKIESAPETAAGDMSRIFGYMKILDPGSTVREGEYASAENARGVPQSVMAQYNKVLNGQRLTPQQRQEFTQSAGDLVKSQQEQFNSQKKYYSDVASHYKIAPENIIYDPYADLNIRTTPPKTPKTQANPAQQLNIPQVNILNKADAIISGGK
jgi:hypothetical protein